MIAQPASNQLSSSKTDSLWPIYYWIALASVFAWAAWQRFSLPLTPIADPDTWGYLSPALRKVTGAEFGHTHGRNFLYPGLLYLILSSFGDFRAIGLVQHLLGLAAGAILLLTWRRLRIFVPNSLIDPRLHDVIGLAGTAIYLLATETVRIETQLRPEGVCGFLISVNLYFTTQFVACSFLQRRRTAALVCGIALVLTCLLLASVRPSFWFSAAVVLIPVATFFLRRGWRPQKVALAAAIILSGILVLWPERILSRKDQASQTFLPTMLFVIHADLIRDQMAADLKENASLPYPRDWLEGVYTRLNSEIAKSQMKYPGHYRSLKFDPEYLWFEPGSISPQLQLEFGRDVSGLCAFYRFYYWRTWQREPLRALQKVARQFSIYYFPKCPAYTSMKFWPLTDAYERGISTLDSEDYRKIAASYPAAADFALGIRSLAGDAPVVEQPRLIRVILSILAVSYLSWLLLALVVSAVIFCRPARWKGLQWLAALVLFGCAYNASSVLEAAIVNSLEVHRYITVQMSATLLTQLLALWLILEFIFDIRQRRQAAPGSTP
jgi:hypothetical protein